MLCHSLHENQEKSLDCFAALAMTRLEVTAQFLVKLKAHHERNQDRARLP